MQKKLLCLILTYGLLPSAHADNAIAAAVVASLTTQVVNAGSAIYMQKNGLQPQYVNTPSGTYVMPTAPSTNLPPAATQKNQPSAYDAQNQQDDKIQFINGSVVQAFPDMPPATTSGN